MCVRYNKLQTGQILKDDLSQHEGSWWFQREMRRGVQVNMRGHDDSWERSEGRWPWSIWGVMMILGRDQRRGVKVIMEVIWFWGEWREQRGDDLGQHGGHIILWRGVHCSGQHAGHIISLQDVNHCLTPLNIVYNIYTHILTYIHIIHLQYVWIVKTHHRPAST